MGRLVENIEQHLEVADSGDILEIGMDRGEGSTGWFIDYAKQKGVKFVGVDMKINRQMASVVLNPPAHCEFHIKTGEEYLHSVAHSDQQFSVVYLDNFDWNYWCGKGNGLITSQKKDYEQNHTLDLTNLNSQSSHLCQAILLTELLTPNAVVICDDTWFMPEHEVYMGKCSAAIPYLISIGFTVTHSEGKGNTASVILSRHEVK